MNERRFLCLVALAATIAGLLAPAAASAQACTELGPRVVIGAGGSASRPLLARLAAALRTLPEPIYLVYQAPGACYGITPYIDGGAPITGTANYWDADRTQRTCTLPVTGLVPDFGMMGTAATLCPDVDALPDGIGDFAGPITSWSLIVPSASAQQVISEEAGYFVYGFGPTAGMVTPWNDPAHIWGRNATSAALIALSLAFGLTPERVAANFTGAFADHDVVTNDRMIVEVAAGTTRGAADATLGFASTEQADAARDRVRTLAYQARGQECGYWPDSSATAFDKQNVRDGHYFLWSAYHFYTPVDASGAITDPDTREVVGYFTGDVALPEEVPLLDIIIANGNIPECAMQVWRDADMGPLYSYVPDEPCSCYYEFAATGSTSCTACDDASDCTAPGAACRHGYCEVQ